MTRPRNFEAMFDADYPCSRLYRDYDLSQQSISYYPCSENKGCLLKFKACGQCPFYDLDTYYSPPREFCSADGQKLPLTEVLSPAELYQRLRYSQPEQKLNVKYSEPADSRVSQHTRKDTFAI